MTALPAGTIRSRYAVIPRPGSASMATELLDGACIQPSEMLVQAEASLLGVAAERAIFAGRAPGLYRSGFFRGYPWRPGYAVVGKVLARGHEAAFDVGDRVLFLGRHASLQTCDGTSRWPTTVAVHVGEAVDAAHAVTARFLRVAVLAQRALSTRSSDVVVVFGLGLIGNLTAQLMQLSGATVLAVSTSEFRVARARAAGLQAIAIPDRTAHSRVVQGLVGRDSVSVAIDAVGDPQVASACADVCRPGGRVLLLGTPRDRGGPALDDLLQLVWHKRLRISGAYEWADPDALTSFRLDGSPSWDYRQALQLIEAGRVQIQPLLTDRITPEQIPDMYRTLEHGWPGHLGVVVDWTAA